jgi:DNA-binding response OmpR family regulator
MQSTLPSESRLAGSQRILIVDDDPAIRRLVEQKLKLTGFETVTAASGHEALEVIARRGLPHLAIVDLRMPGMDGFAFCEAVQQFTDLPVILLTAVDDEETIIQGIERYAEDYVTKPFSPGELVARVGRVLRRIGDFGYALGPVTRVDGYLAIDFPHLCALAGGREVALRPTECKLLYILMRNAGHTVTTDFLLRRLWPMEEVFADRLRVHVRRLRTKIEPDPARPVYIVTERGEGYRFPAVSRHNHVIVS